MVYAWVFRMTINYVELAVTSNFSFLRGASHPEELVERAAELGYSQIALTDRNSFAGIVRAHVAAKNADITLLVGVRLVLDDGFQALCFPTNREAYGRLSKLLTKGNLRAEKGDCILYQTDLKDLEKDHVFVALPSYQWTEGFEQSLDYLRENFPTKTYLGATRLYRGNDDERLEKLYALSLNLNTPMVATNDVHYHIPNRRPLQDVITCIRKHVTIESAGFLLNANAERHLKSFTEINRIYRGYEEALVRTNEIASQCTFSLDELAYEYPDEPAGMSATPQEELVRLTWIGAKERYPEGLSDKIKETLNHELALIEELSYAPYFLTVYDIVRFARSKGILCQGRGSAANSAVCFCLGITSVDPGQIDLLFERFISAERGEPPDIDVDFEHERREEVIQYIYNKYGRHRAGIAATVVSYRVKMALREVGKVMGLSEDTIGALKQIGLEWSTKIPNQKHMDQTGVDLSDRRLRQTFFLAKELIGFPRHLSQHVGGFVITRGLLEEVCPIANAAMKDRTHVEWDKDDLAALRILKIDVLALGMLSCIRKAFALMESHYGKKYNLATIPSEDSRTYDMICKADTVGVFQIESRAQMSMLPRLKPRTFYDLVIEVALVRPGPIQGDMVHPYLRRRQGLEKVSFPSQELADILGKTLGVPLFQEQAMSIAIIAAGFSAGEADQLRRAMATFKRTGTIGNFKEKFINGMISREYEPEFAERCFKQIEGFSDYGFPESHSASFALLAYVSSWLKCHYPDVFTCAILNSLPMGFYSSSSLVRDFRDHKGTVLPPDINHSTWDHQLSAIDDAESRTDEGGGCYAVRLGFRQVKGLKQTEMEKLVFLRNKGYDSIRDLYFRTGLSVAAIERLAGADAFRSLGFDRRDALWIAQGLGASTGKRSAVEDLPLYAFAANKNSIALQKEAEVSLPQMTLGEHVIEDYQVMKLSLKAHPVSFARDRLMEKGFITARELETHKPDTKVSIAGLVLVRQRPGTASGVIFATLEDETGISNVIIWPTVFEANRKTAISARFLGVRGIMQKEQSVIHIIAGELIDLSDELKIMSDTDIANDQKAENKAHIKKLASTMPQGRNFH